MNPEFPYPNSDGETSLRQRVARVGLIMWVAALAGNCTPWDSVRPATRKAERIFLITLDTTRRDRLGVYGNPDHLTPFLDRIANQSVIFEHAFTTVPITLPAHASMFTGLWAHHHGVRVNALTRLSQRVPTLAETLRAKGFHTEAFVAAYVLNRRYGLARGFDQYQDFIPSAVANPSEVAQITGEEQNRRVKERLPALAAYRKTFVWIHYYDPHAPYGPPTPDEAPPNLSGIERYNLDIRYTDRQVEELWDLLRAHGLLKHAAVFVTSDHGEAFYEHGDQGHGHYLYNETLAIPMFLWLSPDFGDSTGRRCTMPAGVVDIAPTILELAGIRGDAMRTDGVSLLPCLHNQEKGTPRVLLAETLLPGTDLGVAPLFAAVQYPWKYIQAPRPELYQMERDPGEHQNLVSETKRWRALAGYTRRVAAETLKPIEAQQRKLDPQEREQLASLGYVGAGVESRHWRWDRDPKDYVEAFNVMNAVLRAANRGDVDTGIRILEKVISELPGYSLALKKTLAGIYEQVGRLEAARNLYEEMLRHYPNDADLYLRYGRVWERMGDKEEALKRYRQALAKEPFEAAYYRTADLLMKMNRVKDAARVLDEALKKYPDSPGLLTIQGARYIAERDFKAAEQVLGRSLSRYPQNGTARVFRAVALLGQGRRQEAYQEFLKAQATDPKNPLVRKYRPYFKRLAPEK